MVCRGCTFGSDQIVAVIHFIREPAEALSPGGAKPRQLRGLVSGGSLRVGSSWVSDGVGRRYSTAEPGAVPPSDWAHACKLGRRKNPAPSIVQPNVLQSGHLGLTLGPTS